MVKILLSCDAVDFDIALTLKSTFQEKFGFQKIFLDVDAWDGKESEGQRRAFDEEFENKIEGAAVLLVFEFGSSSISAWVMLEETDERDTRNANPRTKLFPEIINFGKSFSRGIRIFEQILIDDFGLLNTRPSSRRSTKSSAKTSKHRSHKTTPSSSTSSSIPSKRRQVVVNYDSVRGRH